MNSTNKLNKILKELKQFKHFKLHPYSTSASNECLKQNDDLNAKKKLHIPVMLNEVIKYLVEDMDTSSKVGINI
jgi:hypothetical protein